MTQRELEQLVARATGETLREIRHRGFSLLKNPRPRRAKRFRSFRTRPIVPVKTGKEPVYA
jgi:hypothetical protein